MTMITMTTYQPFTSSFDTDNRKRADYSECEFSPIPSLKMASIYLLLLGLVSFVNSSPCSNVNCDSVKCPQGYNPFTCPTNTFYAEKASLCNCCPGCVQPKGPGEACNGNSEFSFDLKRFYGEKRYLSTGQAPLVKSEKCTPGLTCNDQTNTCNSEGKWNCPENWENTLVPATCDVDGSYAAVQCKNPSGQADNRCFCYNKVGKRIFGWDWIENSASMQCLCSRLMDDLQDSTDGDFSFHCSENGNFEPLQCARGVCYCADVRTGQPVSSIVPESFWDTLSCYNKTTMGGLYLRMCDSQSNAWAKLVNELGKHGNTPLPASIPPCDPDGSYASKQCDSSGCYCSAKNGDRLGAFQPTSESLPSEVCKCARDKVIFQEAGKEHTYACIENGNYKAFQKFGNDGFCVDSDGVISSRLTSLSDPNVCTILESCRGEVPGC